MSWESGFALGLFKENRLIGYRLGYFPKDSEDNLGIHIGLNQNDLNKVIRFYGIIGDSIYRNMIMHEPFIESLVKYAIQIVKEKYTNIKYMISLSNERNKWLMTSLEKYGFENKMQINENNKKGCIYF